MTYTPAVSQQAYDESPYGILDAALDEMSKRGAREGRQGGAVLRVRLNGRNLGHMRMRSVVNEGDRFKFYGLSFRLDIEDVISARRIVSGNGVLAAVEVVTTHGTIRFDAPPGLRAPSRGRSRRQNTRPVRSAA
ncbi:MAG: hypothetical protein EOO66_30690 [Methylobacterium sp.]|nr:MAG: hypothetical protein EOO66_30690 [Methylobacterium sp.]